MEENKVTWEEIKKANEAISTTDIKGKEYAQVNQRVKAFRMVYPNGSIETEYLISGDDGNRRCLFIVKIKDNNGNIISTGTAEEKENSSFINKTSFIENCETSAVGRALGFAGFGIDTSIASAEEVQNAQANQEKVEVEKAPMITKGQFEIIKANGKLIAEELKRLGITRSSDLASLTLDQASNLCRLINERSKNESATEI